MTRAATAVTWQHDSRLPPESCPPLPASAYPAAFSSCGQHLPGSYAKLPHLGICMPLPALQRAAVAVNISEVYVPYYRAMRSFVELPDGGLLNPMPLIFDSTLGKKPIAVSPSDMALSNRTGTSWDYPELDNMTRPESNTTLAFMTVSSCRAVRHYAGSLPPGLQTCWLFLMEVASCPFVETCL